MIVTITFNKKEEWFTFFDGNGNKIERKTEVRYDPLTTETSRVFYGHGIAVTPKEYTNAGEQTAGKNCPFCPENVLNMTPVFPKEIASEGRIFHGNAIVFPNLFPYGKHNGVVIFSNQHYVRLEEFTIDMIKDAFIAAQNYILRVIDTDADASFVSINWNFLPDSGGSILHPHLHVILSESPTNYQANVMEKAVAFNSDTGKEYFSELYVVEKNLNERWIGENGNIAWIHAFSPKSHNDFIGIFSNVFTVQDITEQDWEDFAKGLISIFPSLLEQGFTSFNLSLQLSVNPLLKQPIHVRLIARFTIGQLETSDMNFFQTIHQEPLSVFQPEDVSKLARRHF
ncbi:hypothetical protein KHA93_06805 [Bacillus sp. FJAT-49732]|uniref:Galactose-1-phosphate uridylyltransferase n=1 Tax=Lederbergia citrisecunda TaxID=2833583 RepID=A0A942TND7_9BACI|nr:hypothetical protein [Lederbergia citrisecunda]MBS4199359.1 hypothetical protein [Lederbergia citrisecunda]